MYLTRLKALVVESLQEAFQLSPNRDMRAVQVSIEYPLERQSYPGVWADFDDKDSLVIAGVDHKEFVQVGNGLYEATRWKFSGDVTLTIVALSSHERDNIYDEMVRIFAFGKIEQPGFSFRDRIENNDLLAMLANFDTLRPGGNVAAPGTPWGTEDEVVYEKTVSFEVEGEFVSSPAVYDQAGSPTGGLVLLSAVQVEGYRDDDLPVAFPDDPNAGPGHPTQPFNPTHWH